MMSGSRVQGRGTTADESDADTDAAAGAGAEGGPQLPQHLRPRRRQAPARPPPPAAAHAFARRGTGTGQRCFLEARTLGGWLLTTRQGNQSAAAFVYGRLILRGDSRSFL
jgi:hypothetical protein